MNKTKTHARKNLHQRCWLRLLTAMALLMLCSTAAALQIQENTTGFCGVDAGSVISTTNAGYTGSGYIDLEDNANEGVDYKINASSAGSYTLTLRYAGNDTDSFRIKINGVDFSTINVGNTTNYSTWANYATSITLAAGVNTLRIQSTGSSARPNIDYIEINGSTSAVYCGFGVDTSTVTIQEYDAGFCGYHYFGKLLGNPTILNADPNFTVSTSQTGYSGAGYVDITNGTGNGVGYQVTVPSTGTYNITLRYAEPTNPFFDYSINGGATGNIFFPATADYSTWANFTFATTLTAGDNTIRFFSSGPSQRPNIDYLQVDGDAKGKFCGYGDCGNASNGTPYCDNGSTSDPDGDGIGTENAANCVVANSSADPTPGYCVSDPRGYACADVFPSALSNNKSGGSITLSNNTNVINAPSNTLITSNLTQSTNNCNGVTCLKSNTLAETLTAPSFPSGSNVTVNYNTTSNLSPGNYGSFDAGGETTVNFAPGKYTFNGNFKLGYNGKLNITAAGTVQIYVNGTTIIDGSTKVNTLNTAADKHLFLYSVGNITVYYAANVSFTAYTEGAVAVDDNAIMTGSISAAGSLMLDPSSQITFNSAKVQSTDVGDSCGSAAPVPSLDHFNFSTASTGSTCLAHRVTITAVDIANNTLTDYTGTITLSTAKNRGNWYYTGTTANAEGTLTPGSNDSGLATYTFVSNDAGTATLSIVDGHAGTNSINVTDNSAGVTSTSNNITFSENAFVITSIDSLGSDVIAGRDHQFHVDMIKKDPTTGSCGPAIRYNTANVKAWITRAADDPNGTAPAIKNAANTNTQSLPNAAPGSANFTANFVSGSADFSLITSDVGRYAINFSDTSNSFSDSTITGTSTNFTARPFGFDITTTGNPAATTAAGSTFKKAGENFSVSVRAVAWQSSDDFNVDGIPDFHTNADLTDDVSLNNNATLPSFGKESPAEGVSLTSSLFLPSGGNNPSLTGTPTLTGFVGGSASTTLAFNEVGIIALKAALTDGNYLNAGAAPTTKMLSGSRTIGRFYPAQFVSSGGAITPNCSTGVDYSYLGQSFGGTVQLNAVASNGSITTNYQGDFAKLSSANLKSSFAAADLGLPTALTARLNSTINNFNWNAGVLTADATLNINRAAAPEAPLTQAAIGIAPIDSDGVNLASAALDLDSDNSGSNDTKSLGITTLRHGRVRLKSAHGPETSDLPVEFVTEYWDGSEWLINTDDSCTAIALTDITYPDGTINTVGNRTITLGSGTTTGNYSNLGASSVSFVNGDAGHYFSAPGSGNTGSFSVNVDLTPYPWLRYDWNNDGNHNDSALPSANFSFGRYRGHDRILFWQEVLN